MTTDFADGRMRLTVLGGYLGSGKTTWLRHQLHVGSFGPVHVIVNEAAETGVDDVLLAAASGLTLLAGSIGQAALFIHGALDGAAIETLDLQRGQHLFVYFVDGRNIAEDDF